MRTESLEELVEKYFNEIHNDNNGYSMSVNLTAEFFGISEDKVLDILEESGFYDED